MHGVVGSEAATVDVLEHLRIARTTWPVENQQTVAETDEALAVGRGEVEEVQVDDGGDAEIAVDRRRSRITVWEVTGSSDATGSSASRICGCCASARAMPTRCC